MGAYTGIIVNINTRPTADETITGNCNTEPNGNYVMLDDLAVNQTFKRLCTGSFLYQKTQVDDEGNNAITVDEYNVRIYIPNDEKVEVIP